MTKIEQLKELLSLWEQPDYRYRQILDAAFRQGCFRFDRMTALPLSLRQRLTETLGGTLLSLEPKREERSGQADKVLFSLPGGGAAEAVRLHYNTGWESFCISSQCGCAFGCKFCATGAMGLKRNMDAWEIVEQLLYFSGRGSKLDSVSFMGMGEPLATPQVFRALELLTDPKLFGLSQRRITISTVGVVPGIRRLTAEWPQVNLAWSLHAPTPELRQRLMPVERRWPMVQVLDALDAHIRKTNKRVFLAYTLLGDINDGLSHARALGRLLRGRGRFFPLYHVDLIPYNETSHAKGLFHAPAPGRAEAFRQALRGMGVSCAVRTQFGADIGAACGQLAGKE